MTAAVSLPAAQPAGVSPSRIDRPLVALLTLALAAFSLAYQWPVAVNWSSPGLVLTGLYELEGRTGPTSFRWTNGEAHFWYGGLGRQAYRLTLTLSSARPVGADLPVVNILANGTPLGSFTPPRPPRESSFDLPAAAIGLDGDLDVTLQSGTFVPAGDLRTLGVALYSLRLESAGSGVTWPAAAPVFWGIVSSTLFCLAAAARLPRRIAWALSLLLVVVLGAGLAVQRLQAVALLPWVVLVAVLLYVFSRNVARGSAPGA